MSKRYANVNQSPGCPTGHGHAHHEGAYRNSSEEEVSGSLIENENIQNGLFSYLWVEEMPVEIA